MANTNYKQLFAIQAKIEKQLQKACPNINHKSGIYFLIRKDEETGKKMAYIGKGVDLTRRMVSHVQGYAQRIDISLKKRGFYSEENKSGWKLNILNFPSNQLDEREQFYIQSYKNAGYELYNVESGGSKGKTDINTRKPAKGYRDGLQQGYKNCQKEISRLFEKNLIYSINGKPTANKQKALAKFEVLIKNIN